MYHILLAIALTIAQPQITQVQQQFNHQKNIYSQNQSKAGNPQNPDVINQLKQDIAAEENALKPDLESLGLDPIDNKTPIAAGGQSLMSGDLQNINSNKNSDDDDGFLTSTATDNIGESTKEEGVTIPKKAIEAINKIIPNAKEKLTKLADATDTKTTSAAKTENETSKTDQASTAPNQVKIKPEEGPTLGDAIEKTVSKIQESKPVQKIKEVISQAKKEEAAEPAITRPEKIADGKKIDITPDKNKQQIHQAEDESRSKRKLAKLEELRKKYIEDNDDDATNISRYQAISKILPQKKALPRFASSAVVPPPLLNRYRGVENVHHPIIMSNSERVDFAFKAIAENRVDDFNALFKLINDPNIKNNQGDTFLTFAVLMKKHDVVSSLLSKGADPDLANGLGYTPLNIAIELADFRSVALLMDMGANTHYIDGMGGTYLMQASRVGSLPITDLLVNKGQIDVNSTDNNGITALDIAYKNKQDVIAKFLLKNGAQNLIKKDFADNKNKSMVGELFYKWQ